MARVYKLGDKWSEDFDYDGMIEYGKTIGINTSEKTIEKYANSLEDVNYHTLAKPLFDLEVAMSGNKEKIKKHFLVNYRRTLSKQLVEFGDEPLSTNEIYFFAKGGSVEDKEYVLERYYAYVNKDDYEEGETDNVHNWDSSDMQENNKTFSSKSALMDFIKKVIERDTQEDNTRDDYFMIESDEDETTIDYAVLCKYNAVGRGYDNYEKATDEEKEQWKKGDLELFNVGFTFKVKVYEPRNKVEFAKGGKIEERVYAIDKRNFRSENLIDTFDDEKFMDIAENEGLIWSSMDSFLDSNEYNEEGDNLKFREIPVKMMVADEYVNPDFLAKGGKVISIDKYHEMRNKEFAKEVKADRIKDTDENYDKFDVEYFDELQEKGYKIEYAKGGKLNTNDFSDAINKWVMFSYNYYIGSDGKPTFFEAFGGSLKNHLYSKWSGYYKTEGSGGVMNRFWAELSSNNKEVLANWINNNYYNEFAEGGELNTNDFIDAINKWVMFSYNYDIGSDGKPTFFEGFGGSLKNHLYSKWSNYYKKEGSGGVMNRFWAELSSNNKEVLANWINNNYNE